MNNSQDFWTFSFTIITIVRYAGEQYGTYEAYGNQEVPAFNVTGVDIVLSTIYMSLKTCYLQHISRYSLKVECGVHSNSLKNFARRRCSAGSWQDRLWFLDNYGFPGNFIRIVRNSLMIEF